MLNEFISKIDCLKVNKLQNQIKDKEAEILKLNSQLDNLQQTKNSLIIQFNNQRETFFNEFFEENLQKLKNDLEGKLYLLYSTERTLMLFNDIYLTNNNELNLSYFKIIINNNAISFCQNLERCSSLTELKTLLSNLTLFHSTDFDSFIAVSTILINKYNPLTGHSV